MKPITIKSLLFVLAIGAYTAQTLPMQAEAEAQHTSFPLLQCDFDATPDEQKPVAFHNMFANAEERLAATVAARTGIDGELNADLQTLRHLATEWHLTNNQLVQQDMAHLAATGHDFAAIVALFQPHEAAGAQAGVAEDHAQPGLVANVAERLAVVGENPHMDGAPVLGVQARGMVHAASAGNLQRAAQDRAEQDDEEGLVRAVSADNLERALNAAPPAAYAEPAARVAPQAQGWWSWAAKRAWWLAPIAAVVVIALLYRNKRSSAPVLRPGGRRPNGQRSNSQHSH